MAVAQQLYEGVKLGDEGRAGLITYMRTDSTYVAPEAQTAARQVIVEYFGEEYLPPKPPTYKTRVKSAQEAHEAIRPTDVWRTPKQVRPYLDAQQDALYTLIWRRFVASQMAKAVYDVTTALIPTGPTPNTAMEVPGPAWSALITAPAPVITPHPMGARTSRGTSSCTLTTFRSLANAKSAKEDWQKKDPLMT